jgi:glycosyltransferase involved in cell wall biosynthesis
MFYVPGWPFHNGYAYWSHAMRITLVISNLDTGGAERVLSVMANYWATHDKDVTLITIGSEEADCYALSSRVKRVGMDLEVNSNTFAEAIRHNITRVRRLRKEIRASRPDVVISFLDVINVLTLLASTGLHVPVIVSERTDPARHPIGAVWTGLRYVLYRRADAVVMQSQALRAWATRLVRHRAVHVIPNPVERPSSLSHRSLSPEGANRNVTAVGRLTRAKGYDLLVRAFAKCAHRHSTWSLIILGEGEERESLEALVRELGLKDRVNLPGCVRDPNPTLHSADLFVMSSHYEGFSNSLLEAMACKLAVIATNCTSSVTEIIRDGVNGVVVPANDLNALASAMDRLMGNQTERTRLGSSAVAVLDQFGVDTVMGMWDDLLAETRRIPKP